jgi:hypothetical protein
VLQATQVNVHAATEAQRLLDTHQVAHLSAVSLRQAQIHSATSNCACAQSSIEALTTREERERASCLDLLAARKNPRREAYPPQVTKRNPKLNLYAAS